MRKLIVSTFITLDGVLQAPGGPAEDPSGGFAYGGWSVNYWDEAMQTSMGQALTQPFELVLGRRTYEIFAAHWPYAGDEDPAARVLNGAVKHVATRTLSNLQWNNSRLLGDDLPAALGRLKAQAGPELQVHGSGQLIQTLLALDVIDEFRLWIFPLVLGQGKRLFAAGTFPLGMTLVESRPSTTGVLMNTYRRAEMRSAGSFALAEPTPREIARRRKWAEEADEQPPATPPRPAA